MLPAVTLGSCWDLSACSWTSGRSNSGCSTGPLCSLWVYIHHTGGISSVSPVSLDMSEDPYIMEEEEPSASRALESSLWEIQVCHPKMSSCVWHGSLPPLLLPWQWAPLLPKLAVGSPSHKNLPEYVLQMNSFTLHPFLSQHRIPYAGESVHAN